MTTTEEAERTRLEERIDSLRREIGSATTKSQLEHLRSKAAEINAPQDIIAAIDTSINSAEADIATANAIAAAVPALSQCGHAIHDHCFSGKEREFFDRIDPGATYHCASHDDNGNVMLDASGQPVIKHLGGAQLQDDMADVKFHSLTKAEQDKLPTHPDHDKPESEQLGHLKEKVKDLRDYKIDELQKQGKAHLIPETNQKFTDAIKNIDEAKTQVEKKEHAPEHMKKAMSDVAEGARAKMRKSLQEDVIDSALLEHKNDRPMHGEHKTVAENVSWNRDTQFSPDAAGKTAGRTQQLS